MSNYFILFLNPNLYSARIQHRYSGGHVWYTLSLGGWGMYRNWDELKVVLSVRGTYGNVRERIDACSQNWNSGCEGT